MFVKDPLYQQLAEQLRKNITADEYMVGDLFLTEKKICSEFQVSRATANKAISILIAEGLLEIRKGIGTFIINKESQYNINSLISFTKLAEGIGKEVETEVLQFKSLNQDELFQKALEKLDLDPKEKVTYIERIRSLEGIPSILDRRLVRTQFCPELTKENLQGSLISTLTGDYNLVISAWDRVIRAVSVNNEEAGLLKIDEGEAALMLEAVGFINKTTPLWYEWTLFNGRNFVFHNRFEIRKKGPAEERVFFGHRDKI